MRKLISEDLVVKTLESMKRTRTPYLVQAQLYYRYKHRAETVTLKANFVIIIKHEQLQHLIKNYSSEQHHHKLHHAVMKTWRVELGFIY